jgi:hypothetical protein
MKAFGLLGLLVTVLIIVMLYTGVFGLYAGSLDAVQQGSTSAAHTLNPISGMDPTGMVPVTNTFQIDLNKNKRFYIMWLSPKVPTLEVTYGIAVGDELVDIGGIPANDRSTVPDHESVRLWIFEAYRRQQPIIVNRSGKQLRLEYRASDQQKQLLNAPIPKTGVSVPSH